MARSKWTSLAAGLATLLLLGASTASHGAAEKNPCIRQTFEGSIFEVCGYNPKTQDLRLAWTGADGTALRGFSALTAALGPDADHVQFAMNAGMFDEAGAPIGLYVENKKERHALNQADGEGNFYLKPNGVLWLDDEGRARVTTAGEYLVSSQSTLSATQSGPMLVIHGALHPAIQNDGPSRFVRNGVGAPGDGTAVFVISQAPVSFGKLARLFRDLLKCPDALYLDGAISSLWLPGEKRMDSRYPLGPMLVVSARAPKS